MRLGLGSRTESVTKLATNNVISSRGQPRPNLAAATQDDTKIRYHRRSTSAEGRQQAANQEMMLTAARTLQAVTKPNASIARWVSSSIPALEKVTINVPTMGDSITEVRWIHHDVPIVCCERRHSINHDWVVAHYQGILIYIYIHTFTKCAFHVVIKRELLLNGPKG